jgi:hypothetical protein
MTGLDKADWACQHFYGEVVYVGESERERGVATVMQNSKRVRGWPQGQRN